MVTRKIKISPNLSLNVFDSASQRKYSHDLTVVFIHGGTGSLLNWKYQLSYFSEKYRTIAYDWRGCGQSDQALSYTFEEHYGDFLSLMKVLKISSKPILVAHSYGCLIAQRYIKEYGVEKFVNVSLDLSETTGFFLKFLLNLPKFLQKPIYQCFLKPKVPFLTKKFVVAKATSVEKVKEILDDNRLQSLDFYVGLKTFKNKDSWEWMKNYQTKMLIIGGHEDGRLKPKNIQKVSDFFPEIKIEILKNTGHSLQYEDPQTFNRLIEAFIETT